MNKAFIFPGQGSQYIGMGKDFYDNFQSAKYVIDKLDDVLNYKLSDIIFNGPADKLSLTIHAQPALMAVSIAILNTIKDQSGKNTNELCNYVAGHSLGEYSALASANSISFEDTVKLLHLRGSSMQDAAPIGTGAMAACIGIDIIELEKVIEQTKENEICDIANDNIQGQIVISGHIGAVDKVINKLNTMGYRAIKLNVSAPFHCSLMENAEIKMENALNQTAIHKPTVPIISNIDASPTEDPGRIRMNLVKQICSKVRWRETLNLLEKSQISEIVEIGSSKVLTGLAKKANYTFNRINVGNIIEFNQFMMGIS
ncbi:MAG: ACP S-malonyltransferase [Rickettsiaceae bacterium]